MLEIVMPKSCPAAQGRSPPDTRAQFAYSRIRRAKNAAKSTNETPKTQWRRRQNNIGA
jgi:hypothetical protein